MHTVPSTCQKSDQKTIRQPHVGLMVSSVMNNYFASGQHYENFHLTTKHIFVSTQGNIECFFMVETRWLELETIGK